MGSLFKKPKAPRQPPPTAQEKAFSRRQDDALSREIEEENRRKKGLLRSTLGIPSLLSGIAGSGGVTGSSLFTGVTFAGATKAGTSSAKATPKSILGPTAPTTPRAPRVPGGGELP